MCEQNFFKRSVAQIGGFFASPTLGKGMPSITVAGLDFFGVDLDEMLKLVTLFYTLCLLLGAIPKAAQGASFLISRWKAWRAGKDVDTD